MVAAFNASYNQDDFTADAEIARVANESTLDADRQADADAAGVYRASQINYADVLGVYEARSDVENLRNRRARANAEEFSQQDFSRTVDPEDQTTR